MEAFITFSKENHPDCDRTVSVVRGPSETYKFLQSRGFGIDTAIKAFDRGRQRLFEYSFTYTKQTFPQAHSQTYNALGPTILVTLSLPCLLAYLYGRVVYPEMPWKYRSLTDVTASLCLCYMVVMITRWAVLYHHQTRLTRASQHIHQLVSCCEGLLRSTKRALRLVQEAELVARGFTLVSQQSPVSRLEQNSLHSTQRQCPRLRASLFLVARKTMLLAKDKTMLLINCYPLGGDIDVSLNYLAQVPVHEYGPCVQTDGEGEEGKSQLYDITDGFSVASLKGIKHLCDLHISELFRRLTISLCYSGDISLKLGTTEVETILSGIYDPLSEEGQTLQQMYDSHTCLIDGKGTQTPKYVPPNEEHPLRETYMAVHSLDLHLQAAWLRVRSLSSLLETHLEQGNVGHLEGCTDHQFRVDEAYDKLRLQVKHELHACKTCWEEGISRLEKLEKVKAKKEEPVKADTSSKEVQSKAPPIPLFEMGDPIIEDQVFEAYITEDPVESYHNSWDEFMTPEEKERKKKEKQEAMRLLTELKSVISVRATEREIRENKALEKARSQINGPTSGTDGESRTSSGADAQPGKVISDGKMTDKSVIQTTSNIEGTVCLHCGLERLQCDLESLQCDLETQSSNSKTVMCNCTITEPGLQMFGQLKDCNGTDDSMECKQTECDNQSETENEESNCSINEHDIKRTEKWIQDRSGEESQDSEEEGFSRMYNQRKVRLPEYTDSESDGGEELVKNFCSIIQSKHVRCNDEDNSSIPDDNDSNYNPMIKDQESLAERMARLSGANISFSSNVAAMAAARSRDMGLSEATFGDDDDSDEF
ncbi:vezatin-like isoform X2 [Pecten maximus]|uniref:vezatin-like isoform X2 n=1 Tax=Pecten maximus TaxID=6579 RepID=UPI001458D65F|nr:vezatin-like isoform X2 [Pecten maximus]XP_033746475.1 vezatin-like isoform X2 [Pecten maximus]